MDYGQHVRDLLTELKRTDVDRSVPPYNDVSVQASLQDFQLHMQALEDQVFAAKESASGKLPMEFRPSIFLQQAACERNKRGLLIYHWERLERIKENYYWKSNTVDEDPSRKNLCPAETNFLKSYESLIEQYTEQVVPEISDFRSHCGAPPPIADKVLCRVVDDTLFDGGPIVLESGQTVELTKGSTHYLIYGDAEEYIRAGALQLLETEE